ncbi:DUF5412 family protein [Gracilibacillus kekensis]|uniref:Uncharacterized protein n=1 Tax=Gracilibacillus kekensis TaxID=1027249 RepID=A0A1M7QGF8_9BACI|nr:DUF5412 family protein [Gracilibacillus kekensis]SHN30042.1 hypothetical protein SAMN05216179_3131 [Gracilibacillus kekensis]
MRKHYNFWSFCLIISCLVLTGYSLYSNLNHRWIIAPPNYILLIISLLALILGVFGLTDKRTGWTKTRSWLTVILSSLTTIGLFLIVSFSLLFSSMGANEYIKTVSSDNNKYSIDFYRFNAGAAGSFGIRGELNGPLWFKKRIYLEHNAEEVEVEWENDHKVTINNHTLKLDEEDTYGYQ